VKQEGIKVKLKRVKREGSKVKLSRMVARGGTSVRGQRSSCHVRILGVGFIGGQMSS